MRFQLREVSGTDTRRESCLTRPRKFFFQRFDNFQWLVYTENRNEERYLTHDMKYSECNGTQEECDASLSSNGRKCSRAYSTTGRQPLEPSPFVGYFRWIYLPCEHSREFKKLRQLLQRKCHFKRELCGSLIVLRLFHVD